MSRRFEDEDEAYDRYVQEIMDDETEAYMEAELRTEQKRAASGMSPELINLQGKTRRAA